jgi:hypothetical protein
LVFFLEGNLMIPKIAVEKIWNAAISRGVHNLIDSGEPEGIFFTCLIKIGIINTHPPIFIIRHEFIKEVYQKRIKMRGCALIIPILIRHVKKILFVLGEMTESLLDRLGLWV